MRSAALAVATVLAVVSPFERQQEDVRAGNERLAAGDPAGARARYDAAEAEVGRRPEIDFDRGDALLAEGRHAEAAASFRRAAEGAPPGLASRALQNLGSALAAAGDRDGALRALEGALLADPANDDARWNLEVLLRGGSPPPEPRPGDARPRASGGEGQAAPPPEDRRGPPSPTEQRPQPSPPAGPRESAPRPAAEPDEGGRRPEPLTRQEAERFLDALRAREQRAPLFGRERPRESRRPDAAKDW